MSSNFNKFNTRSDLQKYPRLSPVETTEQRAWRALCVLMDQEGLSHCRDDASWDLTCRCGGVFFCINVFTFALIYTEGTGWFESFTRVLHCCSQSASVTDILFTDTVGSEGITSLFLPLWYILQLSSVWYTTQYFFHRQDGGSKCNTLVGFFSGGSQFCLIADGWQFLPSLTPSMGPQRDLRAPKRPHMEVEKWRWRLAECPPHSHWSLSSFSGRSLACLLVSPAAL